MLRIPDIEKITYVLTLMGQYELALADFYKHCAAIWTDEQSFGVHLSRAEIRHAENMATMLAIITQKKEKFEAGRPFNAIALNTAMTGLRDNTRRLTDGKSGDIIHIFQWPRSKCQRGKRTM